MLPLTRRPPRAAPARAWTAGAPWWRKRHEREFLRAIGAWTMIQGSRSAPTLGREKQSLRDGPRCSPVTCRLGLRHRRCGHGFGLARPRSVWLAVVPIWLTWRGRLYFFKNAENKSIGSGRKVVVLCSLAISRIV